MRKKPHSKQTFRLDIELARLLEERAHARGVSRTEVVEAALMSLLQSDQDERMEAALARRLDRLSRQLDRLEWHVELTNEAIALFVRFWLTSNPPLRFDYNSDITDVVLRAGVNYHFGGPVVAKY